MSLRIAMLLALLVAFGMSAAAWAQHPGGTGGAGGAGAPRGGMGSGRGGPPPDAARGGPPVDAPLSPGAVVQVQLDQLEDDLKLARTDWRLESLYRQGAETRRRHDTHPLRSAHSGAGAIERHTAVGRDRRANAQPQGGDRRNRRLG